MGRAEVDGVKVELEPLTEDSERIPFRYLDGRVQDVPGTEWVSANSLCYVNARDDDEASAMYRGGQAFERDEYGRVFISWAPPDHSTLDPYARILSKIKKKRRQTKGGTGVYGRIIFIEVQWDMELADLERLSHLVNHELDDSRNTIAVMIARRMANVHYRRWYRFVTSKMSTSYEHDLELAAFLNRLVLYDRDFDPILNRAYTRTCADAAALVEQHKAEHEERTRKDEERL